MRFFFLNHGTCVLFFFQSHTELCQRRTEIVFGKYASDEKCYQANHSFAIDIFPKYVFPTLVNLFIDTATNSTDTDSQSPILIHVLPFWL